MWTRNFSWEERIGERWGRLTIVDTVYVEKAHRRDCICKCDCGKVITVPYCNLKNGKTKSCGCFAKEYNGLRKRQNRRLFNIWRKIKFRCSNKKSKNYAQRGIVLCSEWMNYENFFKWSLANGYADNLSIDRIDTNGNYEPSNCRWTNATVQANNRRANHYLRINGEIHTCAEWAKILGVANCTMYERAKRGEYETVSYEEYRQSHTC